MFRGRYLFSGPISDRYFPTLQPLESRSQCDSFPVSPVSRSPCCSFVVSPQSAPLRVKHNEQHRLDSLPWMNFLKPSRVYYVVLPAASLAEQYVASTNANYCGDTGGRFFLRRQLVLLRFIKRGARTNAGEKYRLQEEYLELEVLFTTTKM